MPHEVCCLLYVRLQWCWWQYFVDENFLYDDSFKILEIISKLLILPYSREMQPVIFEKPISNQAKNLKRPHHPRWSLALHKKVLQYSTENSARSFADPPRKVHRVLLMSKRYRWHCHCGWDSHLIITFAWNHRFPVAIWIQPDKLPAMVMGLAVQTLINFLGKHGFDTISVPAAIL